jgi:YVTN family beta-propeller protein
VACRGDDVVERIPADLNFGSPRQIPVGDGPTAVAFGAGAIWVANASDGTVSRIDPETYEVETIEVGNAPAGIAVSGERVWVSVQAPFYSLRHATAKSSAGRKTRHPTRSDTSVASLSTLSTATGATSRAIIASTLA